MNYLIFNKKQNNSNNNNSVIDSISGDNRNTLASSYISKLIDTSMMTSALFGMNELNLSTTQLLRRITNKEYCQAKKLNNLFNVPLSTKFYQVRIKPWKSTISSSSD